MAASGREPLYEYALGSGLLTKKSMIGPLQTNVVEEGMFEALTLDYVFYPQELMENGQPFGEGTKWYSPEEAIHMMYDLEPYSDFSMPFDSLGIITQEPNKGMIIDSKVLGIIAPEALRDEVF